MAKVMPHLDSWVLTVAALFQNIIQLSIFQLSKSYSADSMF